MHNCHNVCTLHTLGSRATELSWEHPDTHASWLVGGALVSVHYDEPIESIFLSNDGADVILVEPYRTHGPDNLVVLEPNGQLRHRVTCPIGKIGFDGAYPTSEGVKAIVATGTLDFWTILNPATGDLTPIRESR